MKQTQPVNVGKDMSSSEPVVSLPEQSSDTKAVCDRVLQTLANEFQVLKPVLSKASLIEHHEVLCLILEETYQFFEKKLKEDKFKQRFLGLYNELSTQSLSKWLVTSDVNEIYNRSPKKDQPNPVSDNSEPVQSKTVNQIVEMFEGQVIK